MGIRVRQNNALSRAWFLGAFGFLGLLAFTGCETVQRNDREIPVAERVLMDRSSTAKILPWIDPLWRQSEVPHLSSFLGQIVERVSAPSPFLRGMKLTVVIGDDLFTKWQSLGFAGRKLILSRSLIKRVEFENQLAAAIAIEVAHIQMRTLLERFEKGDFEQREKRGTATSAQRLLAVSEEQTVEAVRLAIQLLFKAKYDIRGMSLLWDIYSSNPQASPYTARMLKRLRDVTRDEVVQYPPVVDPIVRSDAFLRNQKGLKEL